MGPILHGIVVSAPPTGRECTPRQSKGLFFQEIGDVCTVVVVMYYSFNLCLRATTKRKIVTFLGEDKCTPRENPGYVYA